MEKTGKCEECKKSYNGTNKLKLTCPGCEKYERCAECFKTNLYKCGECYEDWSEKDRDGNIVGYDQLDYFETPSSDSIYTIYVSSSKGNAKAYSVNKTKTFKVLMAKIRYELLQKYKRIAEDETNEKCEEVKRMVKDVSSGAKKFYCKFFQGESELLDSESISSISNNTEIRQEISYRGGSSFF